MYHISYILQILLTYHLLHISRLTFNPKIYQPNGEVKPCHCLLETTHHLLNWCPLNIPKQTGSPMNIRNDNFLVVSTHLKNISQIGSFPQVGAKIKNIRNHLDKMCVHPPEAFLNFTPKKDSFTPLVGGSPRSPRSPGRLAQGEHQGYLRKPSQTSWRPPKALG